jgi:TonB-dependent starch-binding outer membrane protein SusC
MIFMKNKLLSTVNIFYCKGHQRILLLSSMLLMSIMLNAQEILVTGGVYDSNGETIIGANVVEKGTTRGAITDTNGKFHFNTQQGVTLVISYLGYRPVEVIATTTEIKVVLDELAVLLDDAIVIGYGSVKKDDATGSVTAIKTDDISKGITNSMQDIINGKMAGVHIQSNMGGQPGGSSSIRIRGGSSLNASNNPLIVIDGLLIDDNGLKGLANGLSMINPNDIETITVLKDASATAIYGSRASNGVLLITTKKGKRNSKPVISYSGDVSVGVYNKRLEVMDGDEYRAYCEDIFGGSYPHALGEANTDWQDLIYQNAISTTHNISIQGGLKNMPYRFSIGYLDEHGILKGSGFDRMNLSMNVSPSFFDDKLSLNINAKGTMINSDFVNTGAVGAAATMDPTRPVYDDPTNDFAGFYQWSTAAGYADPSWERSPLILGIANPVSLLELEDNTANNNIIMGNIDGIYQLFPSLSIHLNIAGDYEEGNQNINMSPYSFYRHYFGLESYQYESKYNLMSNFYVKYKESFGKHSVDALLGTEAQYYRRGGYAEAQGTDPLTVEPYSQVTIVDTEYANHNSLVSYFGRANYSFNNKYLLTATLRFDGSSRFNPDQDLQWATFPAFAFGWKIKEEQFLKNVKFISSLKLRLGWGITGQQNIGSADFPYLPQYNTSTIGAFYPFGIGNNEDVYHSSSRPQAYNPRLKWEETMTYNGGLDFRLFQGRINGSADIYYKETTDLINYVKVAAGTNFGSKVISNVGSLENTGFELALNTIPIDVKDFQWNLDFNFYGNKNKITKLTAQDDPDYFENAGGGHKVNKAGYPTGSFYVRQQVYDENGYPLENEFENLDDNPIINDDDRYIYKKPNADYLMGFTSKVLKFRSSLKC